MTLNLLDATREKMTSNAYAESEWRWMKSNKQEEKKPEITCIDLIAQLELMQ